jgi:hypothetical protein
VTTGRPPASRGIEILCLVGAAVAPFDLLVGLDVGGLTIRPLQLWVAAMLLVYGATDRRELVASLGPATLALFAFCASVALSTILATPSELFTRGVADAVLLFLNALVFALSLAALSGRPALWNRVVVVLSISAVASAALLTYRANQVNTSLAASTTSEALTIGTVRGTYTMAFTAAIAAFAIFSPNRKWTARAWLGLIVYTSAGILSLARGAWVGFGAGLFVALVLGAWRLRGERRLWRITLRTAATLVVMAVTSVVTILRTPRAPALVVTRVASATSTTTGTNYTRLQLYHGIFNDAMRSPVFGNGAASYRRISTLLGNQNTISENFALEMFHAGGANAMFWLLIGGVLAVSHAIRMSERRDRLPASLAALASVVTVGIGTLTNPAAWDGLFWLLLGLAASV